jgi:hypothetical protein
MNCTTSNTGRRPCTNTFLLNKYEMVQMSTTFSSTTKCQQISSAGCWQYWTHKMAPPTEKSFCLLHCNNTQSATTVQRLFWTKYQKQPVWGSITKWYKQFEHNESICKGKSAEYPSTHDVKLERVWPVNLRNPSQSINKSSSKLALACSKK